MELAGIGTNSESEVLNDEVPSNLETTEACEATMETPHEPTEEKMRFCKSCEYQAPDWPAFVVHVLKPSHVKKVAEAMKVRVAVDPVLMNITCEVCNITCSGHIPWNAHLMGGRHRKAKEEQAQNAAKKPGGGPIRNTYAGNVQHTKPYDRPNTGQKIQNVPSTQEYDFATYPQPLIGLEYVSETEGRTNMPWYECSLCDAKFDDNLKFAHLVGFKHRMAVLKIKRPQEVKGLDSSNKKRSDVNPILAGIAQKVENEEGRKELKFTFPKFTKTPGYTARGGRGGNRGTRGAARGGTRGGKGNRGMPNTRGRGHNSRSYSTQQGHPGYDSYGSNTFDNHKTYNSAYNASFDNPNNRNYQFSYDKGQPQHRSVPPSYPVADQGYYGHSYPNNEQSYSYENRQSSGPESNQNISNSLATALGDLTKLIQNEEDASVALNVSNALTQSLLKFRTTGLE